MEDEDIMSFNILLLGNQDVGKTSYIIVFVMIYLMIKVYQQ